MSDEPNQPNPSGPEGDRPRKRRRRRRNKNKGGAAEGSPQTPSAENKSPESDATQPPREKKLRPRNPVKNDKPAAGDGYRGKPRTEGGRDNNNNNNNNNNQRPPRSPGPKRESPSNRNEKRDATPAPPPQAKKKKRRKPRTKQCIHCFTPCTTIHRVRVDYRKTWVFVCDICWPTRCVDNPHYEFGGTWVSGRIVKPESQLRDEWLAKQEQKKPRPTEPNPQQPSPPEQADQQAPPSDSAVADPPPAPHTSESPPPPTDSEQEPSSSE